MEVKEKWSRRLADWYERLRGERDHALRPRDVLANLVSTLESQAREGLDGASYVPNHIVVRVGVKDDEERTYVRAFVDGNELALALESELVALGYGTRGPLRVEVEDFPWAADSPRLTFQCRFDTNPVPAESSAYDPPRAFPVLRADVPAQPPTQPRTVAVGPVGALLDVLHPDGRCETIPVGPGGLRVGRGRQHGNDLILGDDPLVSKLHARFDVDKGQLWITDHRSTNGTLVGTRPLAPDVPFPVPDGETVRIGTTVLQVRLTGDPPTLPAPPGRFPNASPAANPVVTDPVRHDIPARFRLNSPTGESWPLGSSMIVGSALIDDIVLVGERVGTGHARITIEGEMVRVEDLGSRSGTAVNGLAIPARLPVVIRPGDTVSFGDVETRLTAEGPV